MKKVVLVVITVICILALVACSSTQQPQASASQAAQTSAAATVAASPSVAASTAASESVPASSEAAASASSADGSGLILSQAAVDAFNKEMDAQSASTGQKIVMSVSGTTVTLTVTLNQDIDPASFPSSMQAQYNQFLQQEIDSEAGQNPGMANSTWVYILLNKSGQQLLKISANYTAK